MARWSAKLHIKIFVWRAFQIIFTAQNGILDYLYWSTRTCCLDYDENSTIYILKHPFPLGILMEILYLFFSGSCPRVFPGCTVLVCMGWPGVDRDQSYGSIKIVLQTDYFHGAISSKYHHKCINPAPPLSSSTQYARDLRQLIFNWQWKCYGQCHISYSYFSWKLSTTLFKSSLRVKLVSCY